jgi:hypothetical protein
MEGIGEGSGVAGISGRVVVEPRVNRSSPRASTLGLTRTEGLQQASVRTVAF